MQIFEGRSTGYVAGSVLIAAATAASLVGVMCPGWLSFHAQASNITTEGLFLECHVTCRAVRLLDIKGYEMWSHVIICMGVVALCVSTFFIAIFNCCTTTTDRRQKVVEGFGAYGGFFILIGIVNYVANDKQKGVSTYSYAFFLTVLSSLMATTGGALVALANRKSRDLDHVVVGGAEVEEAERVPSARESEVVMIEEA